MFTIKFYGDFGSRIRILTAQSFTVLRISGGHEITVHQKNGMDDARYDVKEPWPEATTSDQQASQWPVRFQRAIIENENGKTTDIFQVMSDPKPYVPPPPPPNALAS